MNDALTFDYVIVGGGTAGSVIAARLAEDADVSVALLEAGPPDAGQERVMRLSRWMELLGSDLDYDYTIEPQERGNSTIRHSRAKVLGGCSSHNSCIAFRAPHRDMAEWEHLGASGWGPAQTDIFFEKVKEKVHMAVPSGPTNPLNEAVIRAAEAVGLPEVAFNQGGHFTSGAGLFEINVRDGVRQSSSVAYLHPLTHLPPNLTLLTETMVYRVLLDAGRRAVGVMTSQGVIQAQREIILCAGAFDTPKLLMISGIGPADHLREVGVEVAVDLPGVGEHLLDHPEGVVNWTLRRPNVGRRVQGWEVGIFAVTEPGEPDSAAPDLMMHFGLMPFDINTVPLGYPTVPPAWGISLTPNVCRAKSEGSVRLRTNHPADIPVIDFRYFTDPDGYDERVMVAGVKLARQIAAQPALSAWIDRELSPGPDVTDDAAVSEYVRRTANTVYHPVGTCRMGDPADPRTVVDPDLRVLGVDGLRVADASIFPSMTSVNPNITVMMIGEKCAQLIATDRAQQT